MNDSFLIRADRLALMAASQYFLEAESRSGASLADALEVSSPAEWPPAELKSAETPSFSAKRMDEGAEPEGWGRWYIVTANMHGRRPALAGLLCLGGLPDQDGAVTLDFALLPEFRGRGLASEAVGALAVRVFEHPEAARLICDVYPENLAAIRVLEKNGFMNTGPGPDKTFLRFELEKHGYMRFLKKKPKASP